jgi:hypothetical protein
MRKQASRYSAPSVFVRSVHRLDLAMEWIEFFQSTASQQTGTVPCGPESNLWGP